MTHVSMIIIPILIELSSILDSIKTLKTKIQLISGYKNMLILTCKKINDRKLQVAVSY